MLKKQGVFTVPLTYQPFIAINSIQKAAKNSPSLKHKNTGIGVKMLQSGLIDLGYKMPKSIKKTGYPDGVYGKETVRVITLFQKDNKLTLDGKAGKNTITLMDKLLLKKFKKIAPPLKTHKLYISTLPKDRNYTIGTKNPVLRSDAGAGAFNSVPMQFSMWSLKQAILEILPPRGSSAAIFIGMDASRHMLYYFSSKGSRLNINLEKMLKDSKTAREHFKNEVKQAKKYSEKLTLGSHKITSTRVAGSYNEKSETKNWFYAVGGYVSWGKGTVSITKDAKGKLEYDLKFEYHFYDRYNWDKGKNVKIGGIEISDKFMGEFHRQGLAREFDMVAVIKRRFSWKQGQKIPPEQYNSIAGR